jgi:hypothetical protein
LKQLLHLLSLKARLQMTMRLEWLQEKISTNPKVSSRTRFSSLWEKHDVGRPETFFCTGVSNVWASNTTHIILIRH